MGVFHLRSSTYGLPQTREHVYIGHGKDGSDVESYQSPSKAPHNGGMHGLYVLRVKDALGGDLDKVSPLIVASPYFRL